MTTIRTDEEVALEEVYFELNELAQKIFKKIVYLQMERLKTPEQEKRLKDEH